MSDLWIILVLFGVAIVLGMVLFNWWQERKYRSRVEHHFKNTRRDVLIDDFEINADVLKHEKEMFQDASVTQVVHNALDEAMIVSGLSSESDSATSAANKLTKSANKIESNNLNKSSVEKPKGFMRSKKDSTPSLFEEADAMPAISAQSDSETTNGQDNATSDAPAYALFKDGAELLDDNQDDLTATDSNLIAQTASKLDPLPPQLHTQMDLIARLYAREGVSANKLSPLLAELATFEQCCFALAKDNEGAWVDLKALPKNSTTQFEQLICSLQLADRSGAVDRSIIFRFQHSIEALGINLGLHVEWHGGVDALQQAQQIDQFCIEVDKAVEFHVVANQGAFHATKFRGLAEASGLSLNGEGKYTLFDAQGHLSFSIRNFEGKAFSAEMLKTAVMSGFTFQLDIPTVSKNTEVFDQMVNIAQSMATSLEATIIDVNRRPIGEVQLDKIRQQLKMINAAMIAKGIIPGSPQALRLFS